MISAIVATDDVLTLTLFLAFPPVSHIAFCHFALQISISSGEGVDEHAYRMTDERSF